MTLPWRRLKPREDDSHLLPVQVLDSFGDTWWEQPRPAVSHEPRVRMDIQTAVQISSLSDYPMGMVELLTFTEPARLDPLGGPLPGVVSTAVSALVDKAAPLRARMARQTLIIDKDGVHRRRAIDRAGRSEDRLLRVLAWVSIGLVVAIAVCLGLTVRALVRGQ